MDTRGEHLNPKVGEKGAHERRDGTLFPKSDALGTQTSAVLTQDQEGAAVVLATEQAMCRGTREIQDGGLFPQTDRSTLRSIDPESLVGFV